MPDPDHQARISSGISSSGDEALSTARTEPRRMSPGDVGRSDGFTVAIGFRSRVTAGVGVVGGWPLREGGGKGSRTPAGAGVGRFGETLMGGGGRGVWARC